ncbi:archaeosine synthase subunit alpha [Methanospirillum stamsii]|uniref:Pseudouridine synthase n=1 Tax=Methanospirillum stamsii TaxID=1277351 RepID=A0A2V2NHU0_9EURY|nr:archaeosine synthase subunit alpha [Methanospirillum stamsii]PWR74903.1 pseudouridine synthase [Methanospirillum stamsii]
MKGVEILSRDGTARYGRFGVGEDTFIFPAAYQTTDLFPAISKRDLTNIPVLEDKEFVDRYLVRDGEEPVPLHIRADNEVPSGTTVITPNWHTLLTRPRDLCSFLDTLKSTIPPDTCWYLPGAALPENAAILVHAGFDLFDFIAVDLATAQGIFCLPDGRYPEKVMEEGLCSCNGCSSGNLLEHNRIALQQELAHISRRIRDGTFREYLDGRCRTKPEFVSIMRHLERSERMEQYTPVSRSGPFYATSGDSIHRVEVKRFADRLVDRYIPPVTDVAVLIPCSAKKPYSLSQSHRKFSQAIGRRAHELIMTSPLGLVPRDVELAYPAAAYDVPVTGYWDHEERYQITETLVRYFTRHPYRRVIAHLDGDARLIAQDAADKAGFELECTCQSERPTDHESLSALSQALSGERKIKSHLVRGMISFQFGYDLKAPNLEVKGSYPEQVVKRGRNLLFSTDPSHGLMRPTFDGWSLLETGYRVYIDDFVPQGDILAPGVMDADPVIRPGDEVLVIGDKAMTTGRAVMGADEMIRSSRGVAVRVRKVKKLEG